MNPTPVTGTLSLRLSLIALCLGLASPGQARTGAGNQAPVALTLAAQPLDRALTELAARTGLHIGVASSLLAGKQAPALSGTYTPAEALQRLLAGSGLEAVRQGDNEYTLRKASAPQTLTPQTRAAPVLPDFSAEQTAAGKDKVMQSLVVTSKRTRDEIGKDNVYEKNVTNVYADRKQLQQIKATNPGDVFKGMNGVYSMDTRASQSITPNIRGITGEGRTPLTIDGTEQSTNVWLHMFGAGNRSYADPALFRSIEVEKGPSLSRGIKSGVGGAVNIRTIEADDIIPEGENWGIEASVKASSNTKKPRYDATSLYGQDYRDLPGAQLNGVVVSPYLEKPRTRNNGNFNRDDHAEMLTIAARNDFMDILLSRSERTSGNYYAGKNNADRYLGHDPYNTRSTKVYIPNLVKLYEAGSEIFSTASETGTTLIKNNWYLPDQQKIGLQFMRTDTQFGETTPGSSILTWGYLEDIDLREPNRDRSRETVVYENPHSELRLDSYKLSYDIKPSDSKWLNLETSLWHTKTRGTRYQTGASPYAINMDEQTQIDMQGWRFIKDMYESLGMPFVPGMPWYSPEPDHDGTIVANGRQWTSHDRTGFDFSNLMRLSSKLQLTLGGSYQKEKLNDRVELSKSVTNGLAPDGSLLNVQTDRLGPRSGERKEYSATMNLAWQPANWLTVTAGTRYLHYTGKDTGTAKRRRQRESFFAATRRRTGIELEWGTPLTLDERNARDTIAATFGNGPELQAFDNGRKYGFAHYNGYDYAVWKESALVPLHNGKIDSSRNPFANGEIDTELFYKESIKAQGRDANANVIIANTPEILAGDINDIYENINTSQAWEMPEEQSGSAFSPVFSANARITPFGTAFVRYAQTTRFPNLHELTSSAIVDGAGTVGSLTEGAGKPERSTNWEVGYAHDLRQFLPSVGFADVRLSYYNTEIRDFIERARLYDLIQYDKKKTSGVELQSRFDSGRYFGSLGVTYRIKQKLCDKDYASELDPFYNRIPSCMTGGFPGTYSGSSLQPKYSIDLLLGTRLLNNRLELGWRSVYHAEAGNKQLDRLLASETGPSYLLPRDVWFRGGVDTFHWRSVLLHDFYLRYDLSRDVTLNLNVNNLTDEYYLDPMSKVLLPGPGRTISAGVTVKF